MRRCFLLLVLLLLASPAQFVSGQKSSKRVNRGQLTTTATAAKDQPSAGTSRSPSGHLVIGGVHAGLLGILQIEADISLRGPLFIQVSTGGVPVPQRDGDTTGIVELPLSRQKEFKTQIKLANGLNTIQVTDAVNREEKATLEWMAAGTESGAVATPKAPVTKAAASEKRESPTTRSASGNLAVTGLHTNEQAILEVTVGTLTGPFVITASDDSGKVILERKKELRRGETSFGETLALKNGQYVIKVASADPKEKAETVELGPWTFETASRATDPPASFNFNDFKESENGKLSAAITRVNGSAELKVHKSPKVKGFKVKVVDGDGKEVYSRSFSDLDPTIEDWSLGVKAGKGENTVTVSALDDSEPVVLKLPADAALKPADPPPAQEAVEYDWGRVRGYFAAGMIFSKERDDFSHSDMFLDFTLDKNYIARPFLIFKDFNTFFNARLTSIPVTVKDTGEANGGGAAEEECNTPECNAFITSKKAAMMQAGIYLPMYWDFTTWYRRVPRENRADRWEKNALFIAPLAKGGIVTVTGDRETAEAQQFGSDDVYNFYSFGAMLGHYRLHNRRKRDDNGNFLFDSKNKPVYEANPNIAPELISWLTLSLGRWENFEIEVPTGDKDAMGNDINVRQRPWRVEALGRLKIPETPFIIGFDGNFGKGPDDVRFLFGTRFDIGKIMRTLKLAAAQDSLGRSEPAPATPAPER